MKKRLQQVFKRIGDIAISLTALVLLLPFFLLIAVLIKLFSKGPVFYEWRIIGQNGRKITSYKFRTMLDGAEQIEQDLRAHGNNEMKNVYFKLKEDCRVTSLGKFLRKFSIDEFPSLYTVLKGDLTLVGPRPVRTHEYEELNEWQKKRFTVKPGVTSTWVIGGKNKITNFDEIVKLDLEYIESWSLSYDLSILAKTVAAIVLGNNY